MRRVLDTRQGRILEIVRQAGYVSVEDLTARFEVSSQTIRSDVRELSAKGLLRRHHGGVSLPSSTANTDYALRHVENAPAKRAIARAAARHVPRDSAVFLTLGTTVEAAAAALADHEGLSVVTNNPAVGLILARSPGIVVTLTGGRIRSQNGGLAGPLAVEAASRFRCDLLVTSVGAVDEDGWLLDYHEDEVAVAQAMMRNARRTLALVDSSKFGRSAAIKLAHLRDVAAILTDGAPPWLRRLARSAGTTVDIASF